MPRVIVVALVTLVAFAIAGLGPAQAQIKDPAVHGLKRLEPLQFGVDGDSSKMSPTEYKLKVGQGYRWKIKASDLTEYAFVAPAFARNIWIRKIEVGDPAIEIKVVTFDELEFESGGELELFFVAVRPGTYEYGSKGLMERGMVGKIIVEGADAEPKAEAEAETKPKTENN
jgi:plastocyanin